MPTLSSQGLVRVGAAPQRKIQVGVETSDPTCLPAAGPSLHSTAKCLGEGQREGLRFGRLGCDDDRAPGHWPGQVSPCPLTSLPLPGPDLTGLQLHPAEQQWGELGPHGQRRE